MIVGAQETRYWIWEVGSLAFGVGFLTLIHPLICVTLLEWCVYVSMMMAAAPWGVRFFLSLR